MPEIERAKTPPTKYQVEMAETALCTEFGPQLKRYLTEYGYIACESVEFYGMTGQMGIHSDMVVQTSRLRKDDPALPHGLITLENLGDGAYTLVDGQDAVYRYLIGTRPNNTGKDLEQYVKARIQETGIDP